MAMYEEFHVTDHWSGDEIDCRWKSTIVAIATRHADAVDVCFEATSSQPRLRAASSSNQSRKGLIHGAKSAP